MITLSDSLGVIGGVVVSIGSLGWTFFKKSFQKALPFLSKWLCKKFFPANEEGLLIHWRTPRATMDRQTNNPRFDCYVVVSNFTGYSAKIEIAKLWVGSVINREVHNVDLPSSKHTEIHFRSALTDGEYRAISKSAQFKRNDFSCMSEIQIGVQVKATTELGTTVSGTVSKDMGHILVEEHN